MKHKEIKLVLADDHQIVRNGIKQMLESEGYLKVIGEASDGEEAVRVVQETQPDVVIMDISMPNMTGIEATQELVKQNPDARVLILSMFDREEYVLNAVEYGAYGYILKDTDKGRFIKAIKKVYEGEKYFSSEVANVIVNQYLHTVKPPKQAPSKSKVAKEKVPAKYEITKREKQILGMIVNGKNNKLIAEELGISIRTIETHRLHIMKKVKVNNVADLVRLALQERLVD